MLASTERLLDKGFKDQAFKDWDLVSVFPGTDARRYALLNKALSAGEIVRLHRGLYMLAPKYREKKISQFMVANRMVPGSFVSFETALSFHEWIPEKVMLIRSVIPSGRTRSFNTPVGECEYINIPAVKYKFLSGVSRKETDGQPFLIANPLRALADYVYIHKIEFELDFLRESLRIEMEDLESLESEDFDEVMPVYTSKRILSFLKKIRKILGK